MDIPTNKTVRYLAVIAVIIFTTGHGYAAPPVTDSHSDFPPPLIDPSVPPTDFWFGADRTVRGTSISLKFLLASSSEGKHEYGGTFLFSLPTDRWLQKSPSNTVSPRAERTRSIAAKRKPPAARYSKLPGPQANAPAKGRRGQSRAKQLQPCVEDTPLTSGDGQSGSSVPVRIRSRDARAAVRAAIRTTGVAGNVEKLGKLATRARWSAALPQVRLRVTRLVDESESLAPTSYDANRTTSSGGASLWLEARASWQLDRALFATEEVRIAKLRQQLSADRSRLSERVLDLLFSWQSALVDLLDPAISQAKCRVAWVQEQRLAAELDLLTGGWFSRWQRRRSALPPGFPCQ